MKMRLELEDDYFKVESMVRNAFWNIYRPGAYEHFIVHNLRNDDSLIGDLAYVIENDSEIIGHINYSRGIIESDGEKSEAVILGPVAIDEKNQNKGYGFKLIDFTLNMEKDMGIPYVLVVGDENYYSRFGFIPASRYGIYLEGTDTSKECPFFMIKVFDESEVKCGIFHNPDVFDVDEDEVDEFDKKFEYRQKKTMEGQLGV